MATDYGTDIKALDDLPDPEELATGEENAAYTVARSLLEPADAHEEIGDDVEQDSLDLRDYLDQRLMPQEVQDLETAAEQVLSSQDFTESAQVSVDFGGNALELAARVQGSEGPFDLVLKVDGVSAALLRGE